MRRLTSRTSGKEDGIAILIVASALVALLGMTALVIDVGALLDEKRQLQNGADAAALAVAKTCALGACDTTQAGPLANSNAGDSAANVDSVTFPMPSQVQVKTSTRAADGGTILPYAFGQAVIGQKGGTVHATAVAGWSGVRTATVIPLTISLCEWNAATNNGTQFNTTFTGPVQVIYFHTGGQAAAPCNAGPSGSNIPGGFGWVDATNCLTTITSGTTVNASQSDKPGVAAPCNLAPAVGTTVLVPIFNGWNGAGGNNGVYFMYAFAELRVTGYRFPGATGGVVPCNAPNTCVGGYFTSLVNLDLSGGGPNLGAAVVSLIS